MTRFYRLGIPFILLGCLVLVLGCGRKGQMTSTTAGSPGQRTATPQGRGVGVQQGQAPTVPDWGVFRPSFQTTMGLLEAGTAFVVQPPGCPQPIMITATHLFGPDGGLSRTVPPTQIASFVKGITLTDCFNESNSIDIGGNTITIPEAGPHSVKSQAGDVAAFRVTNPGKIHVARLAEDVPAEGERVWLVAQVLGGTPLTQRVHAATVIGIVDGDLAYRYDNPNLDITATSGAPVINASGKVVAINIGYLPKMNVGLGNPVTRFKPYLLRAAR